MQESKPQINIILDFDLTLHTRKLDPWGQVIVWSLGWGLKNMNPQINMLQDFDKMKIICWHTSLSVFLILQVC